MNQYFNESVCQVNDKIMEKSKKKNYKKTPNKQTKEEKQNKTKRRGKTQLAR